MQKPSTDTGLLLQHITSLLAKQIDQLLQFKLEIGYSQFKLLEVINSRPGIQQRDIAAILGQTEASITRQMKLLVKAGLLVNV